MSANSVIEAAKNGDVEALRSLLEVEGADVNERDEHGWTPLNWAAGKGDAETVNFLLGHGADVALTGPDKRTALMIARAASREAVVKILTDAEKERGVWKDPLATRPYCKAFHLRDLRRFQNWSESRVDRAGAQSARSGEARPENGRREQAPLSDDDVVFLHQDLAVTRSMWHGEEVIFDEVTPEWKAFCETTLEFPTPQDFA